MADAFYPFVGAGPADESTSAGNTVQHNGEVAGDLEVVAYPTRIAIFDDPASAPRVVVIQPKDVRAYLEEITATVTKLAKEQGGKISFTVIREVVENFVHAYFIEPTISILDDGNTIRFSDQGPGIKEKARALEYGTTSATEQMKKYIRGVGSGLPYAQQYMEDHGGSLVIEDNLNAGTIVTISMPHEGSFSQASQAQQGFCQPSMGEMNSGQPNMFQQGSPQQQSPYAAQMQNPGYAQQGWPQQMGTQAPSYPQGQITGQPMGGYAAMSPQQMPQYPAYQQWGQPTWPQQAGQPTYPSPTMVGAWPTAQPMAGQVPGQAPQGQGLQLSERAASVLAYLAEHESVGPTDLMNAYGESLPTWSRQLKELEEQGIIRKNGQKRYLTDLGRTLL